MTPHLALGAHQSEHARPAPHQERWLALLGACDGVEVFLWRPLDLERIAEILR